MNYMRRHGRWHSILPLLIGLGLLACGKASNRQEADTPTFGQYLPWKGEVFDLLAEDLNQDHLADIAVVDHGQSLAQLFYQTQDQKFTLGPNFHGVGFHPGNIIPWPSEPPQFVVSAEGDNEVRGLIPSDKGGFKVQSSLREGQPRYGNLFRWPDWGNGLAISPFGQDALVLLRDYDPGAGKAKSRLVIPLSKRPPSVLWPGRITVTDVDGNGVDDMVYATSMTRQVFAILDPKNPDEAPTPKLLAENEKWGGPSQVIHADLNGDGRNDLLVPDETSPGKINILINEGGGAMTAAPPIESPDSKGITSLKTAIDKDGNRYIAAGGFGVMSLYQVPPSWTMGGTLNPLSIHWDPLSHASDLVLKDLNGDGWLDLVVGRWNSPGSLWVIYGPLWEKFQVMATQGFALN